jgi:1-acyl-sn-glycerol-3-phosphate acyltransferase
MLRGLTTSFLLFLNLTLWGTLILLGGVVKVFTRGATRRRLIRGLAHLAERWVGGNDRIFDLMLPTVWDIRGVEGLDYEGHYLIISNHLSWVDIFALFRALHGHAAFIRFFLKSVLIWFPFAGQACWALEFPFMKRDSPEYLAKHPEKRGRDLATTRKAVQRYRDIPVAILNFVEGTRFTEEKRADQESPYRHLLRPRIGGIGFVLASMGEQLDAFFDVTLAYPGGDVHVWDFVCGRVPRIIIDARRIDVPREFFDAAIIEPGPERDRFRAWIDEVWRQKDILLDSLTTSA